MMNSVLKSIAALWVISALLVPAISSAQDQSTAAMGPVVEEATAKPEADSSGANTLIPFEMPQIPDGPQITLEQALQMADERNLSIEAARTEIARADAELYRAWAGLFPNASAGMTFSHMDHADTTNFGGGTITMRKQNSLSGNIDVAMPIVLPQAWAGISAARVGVDIADISVKNATQSLLLMVAQSYYQALSAKALIDVQNQQVHSAARHHEIARTRLVSGVGQRLDVIRARSDLVRLKESLISAHAALTNARDSLAILTGFDGLPMPTPAPEAVAPEGDDQELMDQASHSREDLLLKRHMIELGEKQLTLAWMQFLPTLNSSWQLTHQFTEPGDMGDSDKTRWTLYLMLSVPIYNQTRYADLDLKRAAIRKAQIEAEDAEQNAALEIRKSRRDYATAVEKIATSTEHAQLARETLILTENQYNLGTGSSLAVTDARRSRAEAEINLATRRFEAQMALLKLLRAVGTDMTELAADHE